MASTKAKIWTGTGLLVLLVISGSVLTACEQAVSHRPAATYVPSTEPPSLTTPRPTATLPPTATPPPTPSPTPTVPPIEAIHRGRTELFNGRYPQAIVIFQAVLADEDRTWHSQALFHLGQSYLLNGDLQSALETFRQFTATYPEDERYPHALFLTATAYQELEDWRNAIHFYKAYLAENETIAPYVEVLLGDIYLQTENYVAAIEAYRLVLEDQSISPDMRLTTMRKIAETYFADAQYDQAIHWYNRALAEAKGAADLAALRYQVGMAYLEASQLAQAKASFRKVVEKYPEAEEAPLALAQLQAIAPDEIDLFQQGLVYYHHWDYGAAVNSFYRYIEEVEDTGEAHYYAALSYQGAGSYALAVRELDVLIDTHPEDDHWAEAWLEKGANLARLGDYPAALATYRGLASLYPHHELADDALWQAAELLEDLSRFSQAAVQQEELQALYPQSDHAEDALFAAGLNHFRTGDYTAASRLWEKLREEYPESKLTTQALFWLGKAATASGQATEAEEHFVQAAAQEPEGYYGLRAQDLNGRLSEGEDSDPATATIDQQQELEEWLRGWAPGPLPGSELAHLNPAIKDLAPFQRGEELLALGLRSEAQKEFERVRYQFRDDPLTLYQLALYFRDNQLYYLSLTTAFRLYKISPATSLEETPLNLQKLIYPTYFEDLVTYEGGETGLDPLLFFSLLWQESHFNERASSTASARGLAQVIPSTGEWIAQRLGLADFRPEDLYKPYLSVRFGAWYLSQLLEDTDHNLFQALAGYNSGPGNAARWADPDDDLFVENIGLSETKRYVKRIYEHYAAYRRIYGARAFGS